MWMAIRVSDRVQKNDERSLVLAWGDQGERRLKEIATDSLAWERHVTPLCISVKALKAPLTVALEGFPGAGKLLKETAKCATINSRANIAGNHGERNEIRSR